MSFYVDGVELSNEIDAVNVDGVNVTGVVCNGVTVWSKYRSFTYSTVGTYTLDIPAEVSRIKVCAIAGGGSGASIYGYTSSIHVRGGGGFAGEIYSGYIDVTPNSTITISIGAGGVAHGGLSSGYKGGSTIIGSKTLVGGNGGNYTSGNGATATGGNSTNCKGTFYGGSSFVNYSGNDWICDGGQAGFANGTNGANGASSSATMGAGSGCAAHGATAGKGGDGWAFIEWGTNV